MPTDLVMERPSQGVTDVDHIVNSRTKFVNYVRELAKVTYLRLANKIYKTIKDENIISKRVTLCWSTLLNAL